MRRPHHHAIIEHDEFRRQMNDVPLRFIFGKCRGVSRRCTAHAGDRRGARISNDLSAAMRVRRSMALPHDGRLTLPPPSTAAAPPRRERGRWPILMIGSMAELGADSLAEHRAIVDLINQYHFTNVVLVGKYFDEITHPYLQFGTAGEAREWLQKQAITAAYILVKGSRSTGMEKIIA